MRNLSIPISLVLLISSLAIGLIGCQNRAPSLRLLDKRAEYDVDMDDEEVALYQRSRHHPESATKSGLQRIAKVYLYPHELPSRDYFWGGYVSLIVAKEEVTFDDPESEDSSNPAIQEVHKTKKRKKVVPQ